VMMADGDVMTRCMTVAGDALDGVPASWRKPTSSRTKTWLWPVIFQQQHKVKFSCTSPGEWSWRWRLKCFWWWRCRWCCCCRCTRSSRDVLITSWFGLLCACVRCWFYVNRHIAPTPKTLKQDKWHNQQHYNKPTRAASLPVFVSFNLQKHC
jgi:hypothetical protein